MNHLDEGTIHAWLDGALDAAQSAEIDTHVKSCAECSAKVAEARGLIAASSRILVSLDDVPANVIPKKAPVAPRRRWGAAPWVSGLAAAVVIVMLWRTGGVEQPTAATDIVVPEVRVVTGLPEPSLERLKDAAPPPPTSTTPVVVEQRQAQVANQGKAPRGLAAGAGAGAAGAAADLASAQAPTAPVVSTVPTESRTIALREEAQRRDVSASTALRRPMDGVNTVQLRGFKDEAVTVVGCYRIAEQAKVDVKEGAVTGAAEARAPERLARSRGAVSSAAPAPAAVQKAAAADVSPGIVVRLDSLGLVRVPVSDSIIGAWNHFRADSVRTQIGTRSEIVSSLNKVRCP